MSSELSDSEILMLDITGPVASFDHDSSVRFVYMSGQITDERGKWCGAARRVIGIGNRVAAFLLSGESVTEIRVGRFI